LNDRIELDDRREALEPGKRKLADRFLALVEQMYGFMRTGPLDAMEELELTKAQLRALLLLRLGPKRMSDVAAHLGTSLSSATSLVDRLVAKELVERAEDPSDRRLVICRLSPTGREGADRVYRMGLERVAALASALTPDELATVVRGMEVLAAAIQRQAGPTAPETSPARAATRPQPTP